MKDAQFETMQTWERDSERGSSRSGMGPGSTGLSAEQHVWPSRRAHEVEARLGQGVGEKTVEAFAPRPVGVRLYSLGNRGHGMFRNLCERKKRQIQAVLWERESGCSLGDGLDRNREGSQEAMAAVAGVGMGVGEGAGL